jgi:hypothetical protein
MKNLFKLFGSPSRIFRIKVLLPLIVLVAAIGFSMTACPKDNPWPDNNGYFGAVLEITNQQVWMYLEQEAIPSEQDAPVIHHTIGGYGSITGGLFNFSIGTPYELYCWNFLIESDWYDNFTISEPNVKTSRLHILHPIRGSIDIEMESVIGYVEYIYVDRDVTVRGRGKYLGNHSRTTDINLRFRKGWNALYTSLTGYFNTIVSRSIGDPEYLKWFISMSLPE